MNNSVNLLRAQLRILSRTKPFSTGFRAKSNVSISNHLFLLRKRCLFSTNRLSTNASNSESDSEQKDELFRLSKIISQHSSNFSISRREAERKIRLGEVTVAGETITHPHFLLSFEDAQCSIKVGGKLIEVGKKKNDLKNTRVWLVHKLPGEITTDADPKGRPSLLQRIRQGGVGSKKDHLKAIGRLDINTEGLILVTNNGEYKRQMELPSNRLHRTYRVRVHGKLTPGKLSALRNGVTIGEMRYTGMKVKIESNRKGASTNNWLYITCTEGKNRQIRKVCNHLRLDVTRLIRIGYGDYDLNTIPPGMAIEVPVKFLSSQKKAGNLWPASKKKDMKENDNQNENLEDSAAPIKWIKMV